jgi:two-component system chemotaxis response regulator CheB
MPIRVLVVDDSAFMRRAISQAIAAEPDMEVAGQATNGLDALLEVERLQPDVVTLDVEMPRMDGLAALRHLMSRYPRPVVMLSSLTQAGATTTLRALLIGAVDFVAKPSGSISLDFHRVRDELIQKIRAAAGARTASNGVGGPGFHAATSNPRPATLRVSGTAGTPPARGRRTERLVVIGASTGGPRALGTLVPALRPDSQAAFLIVQHMPAGFTRSLAEHLDSVAALDVREAREGDVLIPGCALVAPGDFHVRVTPTGQVRLDQGPRLHGVRPAVDIALTSAVEALGSRVVATILTGMGHDGADGAACVRAAGGTVLAEDQSTCVVWGMPRTVVERGIADQVVRLEGMASAIREAIARG